MFCKKKGYTPRGYMSNRRFAKEPNLGETVF